MNLRSRLDQQVPAASGAVFRIGFGGIGIIFVLRFLAHGWVETLYITPRYHFPYPGFEWVQVWPGQWMYFHFALIGLAALGVAAGYRYRLSAISLALLLAYVELIDRALFLNHYYWMALTGLVIAFLPLNRMWSVDARTGRSTGTTISAWVVWLLRFQVGMVYFFAGLAKLNSDWLFAGQPLATWLPTRSDLPLLGALLSGTTVAVVLSWAAALFDLSVVGLLLWRRSRLLAYATLVSFHLVTWLLFPRIGLFPVVMGITALIFFDPSWPLRWAGRHESPIARPVAPIRQAPTVLVSIYVLAMVVIPLRHVAIPGDVAETGAGYLGSWHVMLTEKTGLVEFDVVDPTSGDRWRVGPPDYLTAQQSMVMPTDPVMIRQAAGLIADENPGLEVETRLWLSVNGKPARLVDN